MPDVKLGDRLHHYSRSQPVEWELLPWRGRVVRFAAGFFPPPPLTDAEFDVLLKRMGLYPYMDANRECPT